MAVSFADGASCTLDAAGGTLSVALGGKAHTVALADVAGVALDAAAMTIAHCPRAAAGALERQLLPIRVPLPPGGTAPGHACAELAERTRAAAVTLSTAPWAVPGRRRLLVLINPVSGGGFATDLYAQVVGPLFLAAGVDAEVLHTGHAGHAKEFVAGDWARAQVGFNLKG